MARLKNMEKSYEKIIPSEVLKETNFKALSSHVQKLMIDAFKAKEAALAPEEKAENLCTKIHQIAKTIRYKNFITSFVRTFKSLVKGDERESIDCYSDDGYDYINFVLGTHSLSLKIKEDCFGNTDLKVGIDIHEFDNANEKIDLFEKIIDILEKLKK